MISLLSLCTAAFALWFLIFSPWTKNLIDFWLAMSLSSASLAIVSLLMQRKNLKELFRFKPMFIPVAVTVSFVLYIVFALGNFVVSFIPFFSVQVVNIYGIKDGIPVIWIVLMMTLIIAPAEEIFWRGFVQRRLTEKFDLLIGFAVATLLYSLVHVWSLNLMLIAAALVCGFFWGLLTLYYRSLWPAIISHIIWDLAVFIIFPFH